jgi:hypothetical protein
VADVILDDQGGKYMWQKGWWLQHQRLLAALSAQQDRSALMVSGDLHLLGAGKIEQRSDLGLRHNPVYTVLSGPVGIVDLGWLSRARGLSAKVPEKLQVEEIMAPAELNGYTVISMNRSVCDIALFACPQGYVEPDDLQVKQVKNFRLEPPRLNVGLTSSKTGLE